MSLYNMVNGVRPVAFFIMPILGLHPENIPRFRDCFLGDPEHPKYDNHILVYTRVGGGNRGEGFGEETLMSHPLFVTTYDDSFDSTFGMYVFRVPEEFAADIAEFKANGPKGLSSALQAKCREVYPKLAGTFNELWGEA